MGNQLNRYLPILLLLGITNFGCSVYTSILPKAPLLSEKKELQANVNLQNIGGINGSIAYSLTNHLALMANTSVKFNGKKTHSAFDHYQNLEVGLGYFSKIGRSDNWIFEVYGGYGFGNSEYKSPEAFYLLKFPVNDIRYFKTENNNVFGQATVGFKGGENIANFTAGLGIRVNSINFRNAALNNQKFANINNLSLQPFVFKRVGSENLQVQMEVGFSLPPLRYEAAQNFTSPDLILGLGLVYNGLIQKE